MGWRDVPSGTSLNRTKGNPNSYPWGEQPQAADNAGGYPGFAEKNLRVPVDAKVTISQKCALRARKANSLLGCIRQNMAIKTREMIFPHYSSLLKPHLLCCVMFWDPQYKTDMD